MNSLEATFSGLRLAVELKTVPTKTPITKTADKIAIVVALSKGFSEPGGLDLGDLGLVRVMITLST